MKTVPQKFDVTAASYSQKQVQLALKKDGAVVLTNLFPSLMESSSEPTSPSSSSWEQIAAGVPHLVWDRQELMLDKHRADPVHEEHRRLSLAGEALHPHSDGYIWGDSFPDVVILVCEEPAGAANEGANYLIDGYDVLKHLQSTTKEFLEANLVDHTERAETAFVNGTESIVPVIRWLEAKGWRQGENEENVQQQNSRGGHLCWRRMVNKNVAGKQLVDKETGKLLYSSLWAPVKEDSEEQKQLVNQALFELDEAIEKESHESMRFALRKGEALLVDNYRMLHSRESFHGLDENRRTWRIWVSFHSQFDCCCFPAFV